MTTINGKLIATDRQDLELAKQQILDLQQQYEGLSQASIKWNRAKDQIQRDISSLQQLQSKISAIDKRNDSLQRQIKAMAVKIQTQQTYLIGSMLGIVFIFAGGLFWLGNTSKASPAELPLQHHQLNSPSR
jgi:ABC-type transporter Mla subunit MlaD